MRAERCVISLFRRIRISIGGVRPMAHIQAMLLYLGLN
jgi:hypothetical protein